jgi:hypothetical protein
LNSQSRYNIWFSENYDGLFKFARRYHRCPTDLLHTVYLRIIDLPHLDQILDGKPWGYHILALHRQATTGVFAKEYRVLDLAVPEVPDVVDVAPVIRREEVALILSRLPYFDRTLFEIKLSGYNMHQFAKESGISCHTMYYSLRKTARILKEHITCS